MRIINLITDLSRVNFGVWNAALNTARVLRNKYAAPSELWSPMKAPESMDDYDVTIRQIRSLKALPADIDPQTDVFVSHGSWSWATKFGYALKQRGFTWIYTPHGMLEPWSMKQKKFKKAVYYSLFEKRYAAASDAIRAVGSPEKKNLERLFPRRHIILVPNGIEAPRSVEKVNDRFDRSTNQQVTFLFLSRLHHKKGVLPLARAWIKSSLYGDLKYRLTIAGPDDGEKEALVSLLNELPTDANIRYIGAVYGEAKSRLLRDSRFFCLPSFSEGFPTSIVEAMYSKCIPVITDGCNFPEAFDHQLAIKVAPDEAEIIKGLELAKSMPPQQMVDLSNRNHEFVRQRYTTEKIADLQYDMYAAALGRPSESPGRVEQRQKL